MDISVTTEAKSDQLNAVDLIGKTIDLTITGVTKGKTAEQPLNISIKEIDGKVWRPCKNMRRVLMRGWGKETNNYIGKSIRLYNDEKVRFGADITGGIRISHMSHINEKFSIALMFSRNNIKTVVINILEKVGIIEQPKHSPEIQDAGDEAAKQGVEVYTAWLAKLTPEVKASIKHLHSDWTKIAKSVVTTKEEEKII